MSARHPFALGLLKSAQIARGSARTGLLHHVSVLLFALTLVVPTACGRATPTLTPTATPPPAATPTTFAPATITMNGHIFTLEVADTDEERAKGLSGRTSLPEDQGMLFVYEQDDRWGFWMKETLIPLDILWLTANGTVVDVETMQPQPGVPTSQLTVYRPKAPARLVLEINAGLARRYGIAAGTRAEFR